MNRSEILKWFKGEFSDEYYNSDIFREKVKELSAMIAELVAGVPCEKITILSSMDLLGSGWNNHCEKVAEYKKEVLK
jgi:hypothetical protein